MWISHWVPPGIAPKRYATWFFVAPAPEGAVLIDGGEVHESDWMRPRDALTRRDALEIELAPPTWMTLHYLGAFDDLDALMRDAAAREPFFYETRIAKGVGGVVALWAGDVGYEVEVLDDASLEQYLRRHRVRWTGGLTADLGQALWNETGSNLALVIHLHHFDDQDVPRIGLTARLVGSGGASSEPGLFAAARRRA